MNKHIQDISQSEPEQERSALWLTGIERGCGISFLSFPNKKSSAKCSISTTKKCFVQKKINFFLLSAYRCDHFPLLNLYNDSEQFLISK